MKYIVIPTDFSERTTSVIEFSLPVALKTNSKILFLHVMDVQGYHSGYNTTHSMANEVLTPKEMNEAAENAKLRMERYIESVKDEFDVSDDLLDSYVSDGFIPEKINELVGGKNILFVASFVREDQSTLAKLLNNYSNRFLGDLDCPVVFIPEDYQFTPIKDIVFASDFLEADKKALSQLAKIARHYGARITITHVSEEAGKYSDAQIAEKEKELKKAIDYEDLEFLSVISDETTEGISETASEINAGIIASVHKDRNLLEQVFEKSTSKKLRNESTVPVMIFHKEVLESTQ